jgi:flavin reductase (DIM6/NTAB) family NADH-FMN oxidoreductase RutF
LTQDQTAIDQSALDRFVFAVRSPVLAVTTHFEGRDNGLIILSGRASSVIPDAMRMSIMISKPNFTHDLIAASGVFAIHLLPCDPMDAMARSANIVTTLGGQSGRVGDKMAGLAVKRGVTGAPILLYALSVVECRVVKSLDCDEATFFLGDVVGAEKLTKGLPLDVARLWAELPPEWTENYERRHNDGLIAAARKARGLV